MTGSSSAIEDPRVDCRGRRPRRGCRHRRGLTAQSSAQALFDRPPNERETEAGDALGADAAVVDAQARLPSAAELHDDRRSAVPEGVRDQLVGDESELLSCRRVERDGLGVDDDRHRSSVGDAREQRAGVHRVLGLGQQPVHCRDRADPGCGLVEGAAVAVLRTSEQEEVGNGLEVVLDPVIRFGRERALLLGAGDCTLVGSGLTADRPRDDERDSDRRCNEGQPHRRRTGGQRMSAAAAVHVPR